MTGGGDCGGGGFRRPGGEAKHEGKEQAMGYRVERMGLDASRVEMAVERLMGERGKLRRLWATSQTWTCDPRESQSGPPPGSTEL